MEANLPQQRPALRNRSVLLHEGALDRMRQGQRAHPARPAGASFRRTGARGLQPRGQAGSVRASPRYSGGAAGSVDQAVILHGARVAQGPDAAVELDLEIRNGKIHALRKPSKSARGMDLAGHLILPGLINAHDHLEFNLYPRLGRGPYPNSGAWARDVYHPDESPIREQLAIPKETRLLWGGLKNLLSGVTTVCHHNPRDQPVFDRHFPAPGVHAF